MERIEKWGKGGYGTCKLHKWLGNCGDKLLKLTSKYSIAFKYTLLPLNLLIKIRFLANKLVCFFLNFDQNRGKNCNSFGPPLLNVGRGTLVLYKYYILVSQLSSYLNSEFKRTSRFKPFWKRFPCVTSIIVKFRLHIWTFKINSSNVKIHSTPCFLGDGLAAIFMTVKCRTARKTLFLNFNLCQSVILDILSCSFTSKSFLAN